MDLCFFDLTCNIDICTLINDYKQSELEIIHQQKQYQLLFHWLTVMTSLFKILTFQQHNIVNLHAKSHPMPTEGKETFHNSTSMWINIYPLHVQKQPRREKKTKHQTTHSLNHFFNLRHYSNTEKHPYPFVLVSQLRNNAWLCTVIVFPDIDGNYVYTQHNNKQQQKAVV